MDGPGIAGSIGVDDMIQRIRSAKNDQSIKGLILRVDSPGGRHLRQNSLDRNWKPSKNRSTCCVFRKC